MLKRLQYTPKILYTALFFVFLILFFMFFSFGVDENLILEDYKSITVGDKRQSIAQIKMQVDAASDMMNPNKGLMNWLDICLKAKQFIYENGYTYSLGSYDRPLDANIAKATNCGDYVFYCLQTAGFFTDKSYTTAKGVAKYCKDAGWQINTDYNQIEDGDIVWMNRGYAQYTVNDLVNSSGESHIQICADFESNLYYNVGGSSSVSVPSATQGSDVESRFICSFRVPQE